EERMETREQAARSPVDEVFPPKPAELDVFSLGGAGEEPRVRQPDALRDLDEEENGSVIDYDLPAESGSDLALGDSPSRASGPAEEGVERKSRRRRGRRRG